MNTKSFNNVRKGYEFFSLLNEMTIEWENWPKLTENDLVDKIEEHNHFERFRKEDIHKAIKIIQELDL